MIKIEYRIDTTFNGIVKAFFVTKKRVGRFPFRWWTIVDEEQIYVGDSKKEAQKAIDARVIIERGYEIKYREWKNDRGETRVEDYLYI